MTSLSSIECFYVTSCCPPTWLLLEQRCQYSFMQAFFKTLLCITVSPWTSPFVVQAHDDRVRTWCAWLPWISRSVCAIRQPFWRTAWRQWKRYILKTRIVSRTLTSGWVNEGMTILSKNRISISSRFSWYFSVQSVQRTNYTFQAMHQYQLWVSRLVGSTFLTY